MFFKTTSVVLFFLALAAIATNYASVALGTDYPFADENPDGLSSAFTALNMLAIVMLIGAIVCYLVWKRQTHLQPAE